MLYCNMADGARKVCGVSFIRALILFMRTPSSWPTHLPKALPPNIITSGIRILTYEVRGYINLQTIAFCLCPHPWIHVLLLCRIHLFPPNKPHILTLFHHQLKSHSPKCHVNITEIKNGEIVLPGCESVKSNMLWGFWNTKVGQTRDKLSHFPGREIGKKKTIIDPNQTPNLKPPLGQGSHLLNPREQVFVTSARPVLSINFLS